MEDTSYQAIAIVGAGAVLPDAPNVPAFWNNLKNGRYSVTEVTPDRWDPALYYDSDRTVPGKTYSKIGGWVREFEWDPLKWRIAVPPRVADAMDQGQKWAVACVREALEDYGYPKRPMDLDRTAVILGNAMGGERHYLTSLRIYFPEYERELEGSASFSALPEAVRREINRELHKRIAARLPDTTEDTMPGELANCIAGRVANLFNFHGPNFTTDAACASAMAAVSTAVKGLVANEFDVAITGGIDRNMGVSSFVKFCKIGALSATGTRPYGEGADGFIMGEGASIFMMKRLADAERDGDKIYAVLRGMGASSDGKGKGITAPNPVGQKFCLERAWKNAGVSPEMGTYMEGHGTSTRVGDVVEVNSMIDLLNGFHLPTHSVPLGSVKSNFGHLKGGAGSAGLLKAVLALHNKLLPPSLNCQRTNPDVDFGRCPLYVNTELTPWMVPAGGVRRAGVSAFGFGGTNFHAVLEEYIPHKLTGNGKSRVAFHESPPASGGNGGVAAKDNAGAPAASSYKAPLRGALLVGGSSEVELAERLRTIQRAAAEGRAPAPAPPAARDLRAPERLAIDFANAADLADKSSRALKALAANQPLAWKALRAQGVFRGHGPAPKVAFLYTGQGSQYVNMLSDLRAAEPIVAATFAEADRVMTPFLGKPLSEFVFVDPADAAAVARAEEDLRQTALTQPAILSADIALTRLLAAYGIQPDMTMGHSMGEYGALVAAGALPFEDALEAVSARGREMTRVALGDNGRMAAVFAPLEEIERILKSVDGYAVIANINSGSQAVIGGVSNAVAQAQALLEKAGYNVVELTVSHAFHTSIVAGASEPLRRMLDRTHLQSPVLPVVANVNGEFYPSGPGVREKMLDILALQVASPVQFVKGLHTLYGAGARVFVEVGPKKALHGFAEDVLGSDAEVLSLFTNHPKFGDIPAFNNALCGLYAAGLGAGIAEQADRPSVPVSVAEAGASHASPPALTDDRYRELGRIFADAVQRGWQNLHGLNNGSHGASSTVPVAITGAALGLPGTKRIFDDANVGRILRGHQFIDVIPSRFRRAILDKRITRLVKSENGEPVFERISSTADVIKLAARGGAFDLEGEFGVPADRLAALDRVTQLAMGVGLDALRDAGIPLVMRYKTTTKGTQLQDRWVLPDALRDDTAVIFASAFPGLDSFADELSRYFVDHGRREQLAMLEDLRARTTDTMLRQEIDRRADDLRVAIEKDPFVFDRRFVFRILAMGHSQFAEFIGARGPNTHLNSACASTTQGVALAQDWIREGRCRRAIVISADDPTSDHLMEWLGSGFLVTGAAATDEVVEEAALPFDRRRHGMILGMGAAALVVESAEAARERGIRPICEVWSSVTANSAFHGTRLDVQHISQVMEDLVAQAEKRGGVPRREMAPRMVFVSHETYTPARGGSAAAEIHALRRVFGDAADQIVIANTKGLTGHAMGAGVEDVVAVKTLETGCVPPVANFKEVDPELGPLNLSKGGLYPVEYALRLGAGFGSQISMTLYHWTGATDAARPTPEALGFAYRIADKAAWNAWMTRISGQPAANLEVAHRTLRVRDQGASVHAPEVAAAVPAAPSQPQPQPKPVPAPVAAPAPKPAPAPVAAPAPQPKPAVQADPVKERVLALVAEKTGYPVEMLDLDLDLEADLGVDTVKQAEMFAAIREAYGIARDDQIKLRDFPTLSHVLRFVRDRRPDLAQAPAPAPAPVASQPATAAAIPPAPGAPPVEPGGAVREQILQMVVDKTGYPRDMLDLDLDLEADLGVDTVKQAEMFTAIRETYGIPRDENRKLRDYPTLKHIIRFVLENRPDLAGTAPVATPISASAPQSAPPAAAAPAPPPASGNPIQAAVLQIVAEKTGYPQDMLDLDLDLEADLGVDTVKQAEMFTAIREKYNIPRDENRKLRDYPTLRHVMGFVLEKRPDLAAAASPPATPAPVAAAAAPAPAEPAVAAPAPAADDPIKEAVLAIVSEKTGYPKDMLDLELDLEADLGVDTVKQAEMFAAVRAAFQIPRDGDLKLRDFPTLSHVIQFARDRQPQAAAEPASVAAAPVRPAPASFQAANLVPRRVPVPELRPPLSLCKSTGVTLGPGRRVVVMPDRGGVGHALVEGLQLMGVEVLQLDPAMDAGALAARLQEWLAAGPVAGVYWLPALDREGSLSEMDLDAWHEALRVRVKSFYATMRALYEQVASPGTFLISATRLGGRHGYDDAGAFAPLGGAVTGFTKTYKRERTAALVKAVDFEAERQTFEAAEILIDETLRDPAVVEVGCRGGQRWTIGLREQPAADGQPGLALDKNTVFVVTGAAGSIVSAITADLAAASGGAFYLLDVVPEPAPHDPDLQRFAADKEGLKRDLIARLQANGKRATPAMVEKELQALERAQAARAAIDAVQAAGGTAHYFSVNLTDAAAVAQAIGQVRERSGRIDVLLHAAGIERSHMLPAKDAREFDLVFDVKSDGWFNLLRAIGDMPLGAAVAFGSIAGRFGNGGQTDYSAANDLLCKIVSSFRTTRPATRGIAIDWTAWGGIGMATRGSIPKMMEAAGIDMLPPEAGIPWIRRELTEGGTRGEVVVAQRLGILLDEWDAEGGIDIAAPAASSPGPMIGRLSQAKLHGGLTFETTLDPKLQPFLYDHRIAGTPVLPGVMGVEAFAEAALSMLPDWKVEALEDVDFLAPFKFYRDEPRSLTVQAALSPLGDQVVADCRLIGSRSLPNQTEPQISTHFTGRVRMSRNAPETTPAETPGAPAGPMIEAGDIYRLYFHGPAYQVLERAWRDGDRIVGQMAQGLPDNHQPPDLPLSMAPRLIELCFQTAGLWEIARGRMGLPQHIDRVSLFRAPELADGPLFAVVAPDLANGSCAVEVVDIAGTRYLSMSGYRMVALESIDGEPVKALQAVLAAGASKSMASVV